MEEALKNGEKNGKALYISMNNGVYGKTIKILSDRINVKQKRKKQQKDSLKWVSKPRYMLHKIFENDLVEICKNKVTLALNKTAHIAMCILELSKVLMNDCY